MKERPIIMTGTSVNNILVGHKTMTRRVIKPQPDFPYFVKKAIYIFDEDVGCYRWWLLDSLDCTIDDCSFLRCPYGQPGDRLYVKEKYFVIDQPKSSGSDILYGILDDRLYGILLSEVKNGKYKVVEWNIAEINSYLSERRLHGRIGWSDLLTDKIQGLWAEGIRGLVSAKRAHDKQGIPEYFAIAREQESNKIGAPAYLHGFPRIAPFTVLASSALGQQSSKQFAGKLGMGIANRQLGGQEIGWAGDGMGKAPDGEANQFRDASLEMGDRKGTGEPETCGESSWNVPGWDIRRCSSEIIKCTPSIYMPRWASRLLLEVVSVRVERVQDISAEDAKAEGMFEPYVASETGYKTEMVVQFQDLWNSINAKRGYGWDSNPYVWCIEFKRLYL